MARSQRSTIVHVPESRDNSTSPRAPHSCPISQARQKQTMREELRRLYRKTEICSRGRYGSISRNLILTVYRRTCTGRGVGPQSGTSVVLDNSPSPWMAFRYDNLCNHSLLL